MAKKSKRRFADSRGIAERRDSGASYGYLKLPKGLQMFTPEVETTVLMDIFPYEVTDTEHLDGIETGVLTFKKPYKVHRRIVGPNKDSYVCPTTFNQPCPICEYRQDLVDNQGKDWKDEEVKKLKPSLRNLYIVKILDFDGKKKYDKAQFYLFDFSDYLFQEVFEKQLKKKDEWATFFIPDEGCSIEVTFDEGQFKNPEATRIDFVKRKKQYEDDILDEVPNLDEVLQVLSFEELEAKFHGDSTENEESTETKKEKKKDKKKKDKKSDDEEEKPVKKDKNKDKKKGKEKEEETEEEEAPKKKSKKQENTEESSEKEKTSDKKNKKKKDKGGDKCPHGHKFGKDVNKFNDCDDCKLWPECRQAKKDAKKNAKKNK